jgi:hypothetical protein
MSDARAAIFLRNAVGVRFNLRQNSWPQNRGRGRVWRRGVSCSRYGKDRREALASASRRGQAAEVRAEVKLAFEPTGVVFTLAASLSESLSEG